MKGSESNETTLGRYTVLSKLGEGGMGEVYLARDPRLGRKVALKVLSPQYSEDAQRRARLLREARAAAALKHPNITTLYEIGDVKGRHFLAFEYVEGPTLREAVAGRQLSLSELVELATPLAEALAYAHERGVVHRDIKIDNVMLSERGEPKLLDFGLAKITSPGSWSGDDPDSAALDSTGALMGTPSAMSPEQVLGSPIDARSDVFSFGSLLYLLASGRAPFAGASLLDTINQVVNDEPRPLAELRPDLPAYFLAVIERALRKDPDARYQHMGELVADLHRQDRRATSIVLQSGKVRKRRPPSWRILVVGVALLLVALILLDVGGLRGLLGLG